jgi:hypothetical protein
MMAKQLRELDINELLRRIDLGIRVLNDRLEEIEDKKDFEIFIIYLMKELLEILEKLGKMELEEKAKL